MRKNRSLTYDKKLDLIDDASFMDLVDDFKKDYPEYNPSQIALTMASAAISNPIVLNRVPRISLKRNFHAHIDTRPGYNRDCEYAIMTTKSGVITHLIELSIKPESIVGLNVELLHTHLGYIDEELYSLIYASIWDDCMIGTWKDGKIDIFRLHLIPDPTKVTWSELHNAFVAVDNTFWIKAQVHDLNWDPVPEDVFRIFVAGAINDENSGHIAIGAEKELLENNVVAILHDRNYQWTITNPGYTKLGFEVCLNGISGSITASISLAWLDPKHNENLQKYLETIKDNQIAYRL